MNLNDYYHNVYSQRGEDGILEYIFDQIGIKKGSFVEFGAWDGRYLCNSRLLFEKGWNGLFIEGDPEKFQDLKKIYNKSNRIISLNVMVREHGVNSFDNIIDKYFNQELDFVSIDVDGLDYYLFKSIKKHLPKVICVEGGKYIHPLSSKLINKKIASAYVGQSLKQFQKIAEKKGYIIVCFTQNIIMVQKKYQSLFPVSTNLQDLYLSGIARHSFEDIKYMKKILARYSIHNKLISNLSKSKLKKIAPNYRINHSTISFNPIVTNHVQQIFPLYKNRCLIKKIRLDQLLASVVIYSKNEVTSVKNLPLSKTPHYAYLKGNVTTYLEYITKFGKAVGYGKEHSRENFDKLIRNFYSYLSTPNNAQYIVCYEQRTLFGKRYVILDGVHRAAILTAKNINYLPVCIIKQNDLRELEQFDTYLDDYKDDFLEWYTPLEIKGRVINERTYPKYIERPAYLTNRERGKSKWDFIIKGNLPSLKGKTLCDLGCNIGLYSIYLSQLGAKLVDGYDRTETIIQPTNIELPRQNVVQQAYFVRNLFRLAGVKIPDSVRYIEKDLAELDFSKLKYDMLFSSCVLYHFGKKKFREFIRQVSGNIPELFLQTNLGHKGGELEETASLDFHKKVLTKYGYKVLIVAPPNYNYPVIYAKKFIK